MSEVGLTMEEEEPPPAFQPERAETLTRPPVFTRAALRLTSPVCARLLDSETPSLL